MAAIVAGSRCQIKMPRPDAYGPSGDLHSDLLLDCCVWTCSVLVRRDLV
jgi:hypothetical protein